MQRQGRRKSPEIRNNCPKQQRSGEPQRNLFCIKHCLGDAIIAFAAKNVTRGKNKTSKTAVLKKIFMYAILNAQKAEQ